MRCGVLHARGGGRVILLWFFVSCLAATLWARARSPDCREARFFVLIFGTATVLSTWLVVKGLL